LKNIQLYVRALAILILAGYGVFTWWMIRQTGESEVDWSRLVYLYEGIEAIVFAAAGVIFGTSIHRAQLDDARKGELEARRLAADVQSDAEVGRGLDAALRADLSELAGYEMHSARAGRIKGQGRARTDQPDNEEDPVVAYLLRLSDELKTGMSGGESPRPVGGDE
jgi:hypothetical protein